MWPCDGPVTPRWSTRPAKRGVIFGLFVPRQEDKSQPLRQSVPDVTKYIRVSVRYVIERSLASLAYHPPPPPLNAPLLFLVIYSITAEGGEARLGEREMVEGRVDGVFSSDNISQLESP